jgi:hypothetical protein
LALGLQSNNYIGGPMKTLILALTVTFSLTSFAANTHKSFSFQYKAPKNKMFTISKQAASRDEAYKLAAKDCFQKLTGNKYPGEEKGLEIIDICANPKI